MLHESQSKLTLPSPASTRRDIPPRNVIPEGERSLQLEKSKTTSSPGSVIRCRILWNAARPWTPFVIVGIRTRSFLGSRRRSALRKTGVCDGQRRVSIR